MRSDWKEVERRIASVTKSGRRPVAVTFLDGEPADIEKFEDSERRAAASGDWRRMAALFTRCRKATSTAPWARTRTISHCRQTGKRKQNKR